MPDAAELTNAGCGHDKNSFCTNIGMGQITDYELNNEAFEQKVFPFGSIFG